MTMAWKRVLALLAGLLLPGALLLQGLPTWALGSLVGEILGAVHFLWISLSVRRGLGTARSAGWYVLNSFARLAFAAGVFWLALKWPAVNVGSVILGFTLVLLPASILRLDQAGTTKENAHECHS